MAGAGSRVGRLKAFAMASPPPAGPIVPEGVTRGRKPYDVALPEKCRCCARQGTIAALCDADGEPPSIRGGRYAASVTAALTQAYAGGRGNQRRTPLKRLRRTQRFIFRCLYKL